MKSNITAESLEAQSESITASLNPLTGVTAAFPAALILNNYSHTSVFMISQHKKKKESMGETGMEG